MRPNISSRRLAGILAIFTGIAAPALGRGDTVDASSTTMLLLREQARAGESVRLAPAYEILSISARNVTNPVADDLQLVFSAWGAASLGNNWVRYDLAAPERRAFGDLELAYLQGELLRRNVQLRLGRQVVVGGVTGAIQLDGANVLVRLPWGGLAGYVGAPVTQRLESRGLETSFNPARGNLAEGGRVFFTLPRWGELGVSAVNVTDRGDPSRQQAGADLRLVPIPALAVYANGNYDLYESRWAEASLLGTYQVDRKLSVGADVRHVEPDLFLSRASILSVFSSERRNEAGASVQYGPWQAITFLADYHFQRDFELFENGHRLNGRATWRPAAGTTAGVELGLLRSVDDSGYFQARAFGAKEIRRFTATLDLQEYAFRQQVNGQKNSFIAIGSVAYALGGGWSALVSGAGSQTPYYESRVDVMAKLVYNQSYHLREVR